MDIVKNWVSLIDQHYKTEVSLT